MGLRNTQRKAIVSHQPKLREINVNINASEALAADVVASGLDKSRIREIIRVSATEHVIVLLSPFNALNTAAPAVQVTSLTAGAVISVKASDFDRVTVESDVAADFSMRVLGCDNKLTY